VRVLFSVSIRLCVVPGKYQRMHSGLLETRQVTDSSAPPVRVLFPVSIRLCVVPGKYQRMHSGLLETRQVTD